jgi:hypothetical protein
MVKQAPEPTIRALSKYLKIDDRDGLEEVHRFYKEIYQPVRIPRRQRSKPSLLGWRKRIHERKPPNRNSIDGNYSQRNREERFRHQTVSEKIIPSLRSAYHQQDRLPNNWTLSPFSPQRFEFAAAALTI